MKGQTGGEASTVSAGDSGGGVYPPMARLPLDDGSPAWKQVNALFARHGLPEPPGRLRDEIVVFMLWSRYGVAK